MRQIDWYFDFISPFSYLQSELLHTLPAVVHRLFRYVWREGKMPTDAGNWQDLLRELNASEAMLESAEVKQQLRINGESAIAAGVFGVPTAVVDDRCFWGLDGTDMLLAYLHNDSFFRSEQLKHAQQLPPGIQRDIR